MCLRYLDKGLYVSADLLHAGTDSWPQLCWKRAGEHLTTADGIPEPSVRCTYDLDCTDVDRTDADRKGDKLSKMSRH